MRVCGASILSWLIHARLRLFRVQYLPVTRGGDEVQAAVHPVVRHLPPVYTGFSIEEVFKLTVDVVDDRLPAERKKRRIDQRLSQMQRLRNHCITACKNRFKTIIYSTQYDFIFYLRICNAPKIP